MTGSRPSCCEGRRARVGWPHSPKQIVVPNEAAGSVRRGAFPIRDGGNRRRILVRRNGSRRTFDRRTALKTSAGRAGAAALGGRGWSAAAQDATPAGGGGFDLSGMEISGDVEISYWQYEFASKTTLVDELIPEFEEANPGITVRHENFPYDDFQAQVADFQAGRAGRAQRLLRLDPRLRQQQVLTPLQEAFPHDVIESEYFPMVTAAKVGAEYYALPTARTLALFVNNDILGEAGLEPPTTWEETVEVALATTQKNGDDFEVVGMTWDIGGQGITGGASASCARMGCRPTPRTTVRCSGTRSGRRGFRVMTAFLLEHEVTQSGFMTDGQTAFGNARRLHVDGSYRVGSYANDFPDLNRRAAARNVEQGSFASFWANTITRTPPRATSSSPRTSSSTSSRRRRSCGSGRRLPASCGPRGAGRGRAVHQRREAGAVHRVPPFCTRVPRERGRAAPERDGRVRPGHAQRRRCGHRRREAAVATQERLDEYWAAIDEGSERLTPSGRSRPRSPGGRPPAARRAACRRRAACSSR